MKRTLKNILMIALILLMVCAMFFTMNYAKSNSTTAKNNQSIEQGESKRGTPPAKPGDKSENEEAQNLSENSNERGPEKPSNDNKEEPPEKPDGESNNEGDMQKPTEMPDNQDMKELDKKQNNLSYVYYIAFGTEGLILSISLVYLILSKFNKITVKEVFTNKNKIIILMISIVILTSVLTVLDIYLTNNYFLNTSNSKMTDGMMERDDTKKPSGNSGSSVSYTGVKEITEDTTITGETVTSSNSDENALLINGKVKATISDSTVEKTGDSDGGDSSSFYGNNSAIIAKGGAELTIDNITVNTNASGANGVFSYGGSATTNNSSSDGTTVTISNSKITTTGDNAGGIMTTGGGITKATNLTITTSGTSSAAIRTDRGGGTVTVDKGTYTTNGQGSPTIYSTADITVNDAKLISNASEGIVIEGANSVTINNCELTDSNTKLNGKSTTYKNIFLYQSMSGDAANGNASFTAKNSNIITNNGDTFYITNTTATINLSNNTITNNDKNGYFLRAEKGAWGKSGSNGGIVTLVMNNQSAIGNISVDSISTLEMEMNESSYYEGTINGDNTAKNIKLVLDKTSKIKLTGDSYVTSLNDSDSSYSNIDFNGYKLYVNGVAINN